MKPSTPEGDQLIGNSSNKNMPNAPPVDLRGRTDFKDNHNLLGFQISNLTHLDSGIYLTECWKNQTIISQKTQQLTVCKKEIQSELINLNKSDGGTELLCRSSAIGSEGTSVRWYYEMLPSYEPTLFLDSSISLKPLVEELAGFVAVRDNGELLVFNNMLKKNTYFKCLVIKERVQWHRFGLSDQYEIIYNSQDKTIPIPEDLRHRVTLSEDGSSLTIYNLEMNDGGKYGAPSAAFNATTFAVVAAVLVGLLVVGTIVTAVAVKKRVWASPTQREVTPDIKMNVDPSCTERLTPSE
ncbi:uncharacterized protein LOC115782014 [Archocentrus centrarchus]|uniref:uncharacterized protein LOC115782014 n=1 Tax=Archocentrus centrarchus TaxID=63155 RepID=UPI0011EA05CA|nr:uncharacterized protein LOC115782014 [Archocentrus centrarchus]